MYLSNTDSYNEIVFLSILGLFEASIASQAGGRGFKHRLAIFKYEITFEIYHWLYGEGKRGETCTACEVNQWLSNCFLSLLLYSFMVFELSIT